VLLQQENIMEASYTHFHTSKTKWLHNMASSSKSNIWHCLAIQQADELRDTNAALIRLPR